MAFDFVSLLTSIVAGGLSGAGSSILASRSTDRRRESEAKKNEGRQWDALERRHPHLIAEMREAFLDPEGAHVRAFFLKTSNTALAFVSEPSFEFHTDVHPGALAAARELERLGYIRDVTPGNTPMFRVTEGFIDRLGRPPG